MALPRPDLRRPYPESDWPEIGRPGARQELTRAGGKAEDRTRGMVKKSRGFTSECVRSRWGPPPGLALAGGPGRLGLCRQHLRTALRLSTHNRCDRHVSDYRCRRRITPLLPTTATPPRSAPTPGFRSPPHGADPNRGARPPAAPVRSRAPTSARSAGAMIAPHAASGARSRWRPEDRAASVSAPRTPPRFASASAGQEFPPGTRHATRLAPLVGNSSPRVQARALQAPCQGSGPWFPVVRAASPYAATGVTAPAAGLRTPRPGSQRTRESDERSGFAAASMLPGVYILMLYRVNISSTTGLHSTPEGRPSNRSFSLGFRV